MAENNPARYALMVGDAMSSQYSARYTLVLELMIYQGAQGSLARQYYVHDDHANPKSMCFCIGERLGKEVGPPEFNQVAQNQWAVNYRTIS